LEGQAEKKDKSKTKKEKRAERGGLCIFGSYMLAQTRPREQKWDFDQMGGGKMRKLRKRGETDRKGESAIHDAKTLRPLAKQHCRFNPGTGDQNLSRGRTVDGKKREDTIMAARSGFDRSRPEKAATRTVVDRGTRTWSRGNVLLGTIGKRKRRKRETQKGESSSLDRCWVGPRNPRREWSDKKAKIQGKNWKMNLKKRQWEKSKVRGQEEEIHSLSIDDRRGKVSRRGAGQVRPKAPPKN